MSEIGEGFPVDQKAVIKKQEVKSWQQTTKEELQRRVQELYKNGLTDGLIAAELNLGLDRVKTIKNELGLASMTARQSHVARRSYVRNQPKRSYEITPPPLEDIDSEE